MAGQTQLPQATHSASLRRHHLGPRAKRGARQVHVASQHRIIGSGQRTANRDLNYVGYTGNANTLALLPLLMGELTAATLDLQTQSQRGVWL